MSDLLEMMVGQYLSCNGEAFVCPQFDVKYDAERGWGGSNPDFVVLDFRKKDLVVVEVSGGSSIEGLLGKVEQREQRWFAPTKRKLLDEGAITEEWNLRFLGFVRQDVIAGARARFSDSDVTFKALEEIAFGWSYWEERMTGLPGGPGQSPSG